MTKNTKRAEDGWAGTNWDELVIRMLADNYDWKQHSTIELLGLLRQQGCREIPMLQDLVRIELNKRPNIPTKAQAKEIRRKKAQEQRNR